MIQVYQVGATGRSLVGGFFMIDDPNRTRVYRLVTTPDKPSGRGQQVAVGQIQATQGMIYRLTDTPELRFVGRAVSVKPVRIGRADAGHDAKASERDVLVYRIAWAKGRLVGRFRMVNPWLGELHRYAPSVDRKTLLGEVVLGSGEALTLDIHQWCAAGAAALLLNLV